MLTETEQTALRHRTAALIGLGGLGGFSAEFLSRLGTGTLILCDGDCFSESNLNRQILAHSENTGHNKAEVSALRVKLIDPQIRTRVFPRFLTAENAPEILDGADIVIDGLDTVSGRLLLEDFCAELSLPLVHGAICGWDYQAAVSRPGSGFLHRLYRNQPDRSYGPAFPMTAASCASLQVSLALGILLDRSVETDMLYCGSLSEPYLSCFPFL